MRFSPTALMAAMMVASGMLSAAPVKPAIGSTAVFKMMKINAATNLTAPAPTTGCTPKIATWGASNQCRGSVGAMADGAIVAVASSSGFSGSANFSCDAATNTLTLQPGSTCTSTAAAPSPCSSQAVNWSVGGNACSATAPSGSHASTVGVTDNLSPSTGSAQFACYSGTYAQVGSATCNLPASCIVTTGMGGVWGAGCQANYAANESVPHGSNRTLTDPGPFGYNGSATYVCNDGAMVYQSGSCANTPAPANCTSQSVSWSSGGTTCTGTAPATAHAGTTAPISAAAPNSGSASFTCSNGTLSLAGGSSCLPPPAPAPANCGASVQTWTVGAQTCSASVGATSNNGVVTATDSSAPTTGSASFLCSNGTYTLQSGSSCTSVAAFNNFGSPQVVWAFDTVCIVNTSGGVSCFGAGADYRMGNNSTANSLTGVSPSGMTSGVTAFTQSWDVYSCAVQSGVNKCWGARTFAGWPSYRTPATVNEIALPASDATKCRIVGNQAQCMGKNSFGEVGNGNNTTQSSYVNVVNGGDISRFGYSFRGLKNENTYFVNSAICGITTDKKVKCWGDNRYGQVGDGTTTSRNVATYVSGLTDVEELYDFHWQKCAVRSNNDFMCWGHNTVGNLGSGGTTNVLSPVLVGNFGGVKKAFMANNFTCTSGGSCNPTTTVFPSYLLTNSGNLYIWGKNNNNTFGDGSATTATRTKPTTPVITNAENVFATQTNICAQLMTGEVMCWGSGSGKFNGDNTTTTRTLPTKVNGSDGTVLLTGDLIGGYCAHKSRSQSLCWGLSANSGNAFTANH